MVTVPGGTGDPVPGRSWPDEDAPAAGEGPGRFSSVGLPAIPFIGAALRRGAWLWCATAAAGLLIGLALSVVLPPADQAATSVLLTHNPDEGAADAILTDVAMARSQTVAERAMRRLGLRQSVSSFLAAYTVTPSTDRMLLISAGAPTVREAEAWAKAVAASFLQFRAEQVRAQEPGVLAVLNGRITAAWQKAESLAAQVARMPAHPVSRTAKATLKRLTARSRQADKDLAGLQAAAISYQVNTASEVADSGVVDPAAAITHTHRSLSPGLLNAILYAATGLIPGLALGAGFVIVAALLSDRLYRRDDVARALGAPVGLSVGALRLPRWLPGGPRRVAARGRDEQRIGRHLRGCLPQGHGSPAALAVVAVDDAGVAALSLASLARSCAAEGSRVVLADLGRGAPAARLLGIREPGVHKVDVNGAVLLVAVPGDGAGVAAGPLRRGSAAAWAQPAPDLAAASASADLLLTLVQLDPALGGEHLATWAADAVVMVTAGRSSGAKIHAAGEMIRIAGVRLAPAVLTSADKGDESLGVVRLPARSAPMAYSVPSL
jgi:capsular polysaccharide biosynthesis protein